MHAIGRLYLSDLHFHIRALLATLASVFSIKTSTVVFRHTVTLIDR